MKHTTWLFGFLVIFLAFPSMANLGRYQRGNAVYREKLSECAMWWYRLGDITKSNGKRMNSGDLALELGKLSETEIRQWLADPLSVGPRVNCTVGKFTTERQVQDLIHYLQRRAQDPVQKPVMTHEPLKRSTIRLLRTQAVVRERIRVREEIRQMNRKSLRPVEPIAPVRGPAMEGK